MKTAQQKGAPRTRRRRFLIWSLLGAAVLVLLVVLITPVILERYVTGLLADAGAVHARIEDIDFNPFAAVVHVEALRAFPEQEDEVLRIADAVINYSWRPLWHHRIHIQKLEVSNVTLEVLRREDGGLTIGGLKLPGKDKQREEEGKWEVGFDGLRLEDVRINYQDGDNRMSIVVKKADISAVESWNPSDTGPVSLHLIINGHPLKFTGSSAPFADSPSLEGSISMDGLNLDPLAFLLQPSGIADLAGSLAMNTEIAVQLNERRRMAALLKGDISITDFRLEGRDAEQFAASSLAWKGELEISPGDPGREDMTTGDALQAGGLRLHTDGALQLQEAVVRTTAYKAEDLDLNWQGAFGVGRAAAGTLPDVTVQGSLSATAAAGSIVFEKGGISGALEVDVSLTVERQGEGMSIVVRGPLSVKGLQGEFPDFSMRQQQTGWDGTLEADYRKSVTSLSGDGKLAAGETHASFERLKYELTHEKLGAGGTFFLDKKRDSPLELTIQADISGSNLRLADAGHQRAIGMVKDYVFSAAQFSLPVSLQGEQLTLSGFRLLEYENTAENAAEQQFAGTLQEITLQKPTISRDAALHLAADSAELRSLRFSLDRDSAGTLVFFREWAEVTGGRGKAEERDAGQKPRLTFSLGTLNVQGDNAIFFNDNSVTPDFSASLSPFSLTIEHLSNVGDKEMRLELQGQAGQYGNLAVSGAIQPFEDEIDMDLEIDIREYDLTHLSPYIRKYTGYTVDSGQLRADVFWLVTDNRLDGLADLLLVKPEFDKAADAGQEEVTADLDLQLNQGLDLMRDKQRNINLSIPLTGDISDPRFQFGRVFWTAFGRALQKSTLSYFAPIGVAALTGATLPVGALWVAGKLFSDMTALRFEPIRSAPLHGGITPAQEERLDKLVGLLKERPEAELVICGIAAGPDLAALRRTTGTEPEAVEEVNGAEPPGEEELETLRELAQQRAQAVKSYLVHAGIPSDRLITCRPEYSPEPEAEPGVELGI